MDPQANPSAPNGHEPQRQASVIPARDGASDPNLAAQHVARQQVEHLYRTNPPHQLDQPANHQTGDDPYHRTHQPIHDWQHYHTAWQQYYQQYYQRYYTSQLQAERQRQAEQLAASQPPTPPQTITGSDETDDTKSQAQRLREDLLAKVRERSTKLRRSHHFMPLVSAVVVGLLFLFLQYNRLLVAQIEAYISPGTTVDASENVIIDPTANANVGNEPKVIIPKINVNVPVVYDVATIDDKQVQAALERGVVHYNLPGADSVPGQSGNMVILGHSSNDVFDPGGFKFAFVLIDRLQNGDTFYMNYQGKRYIYRVTDKKIIKPNEWQILQQNSGKPTAVLVTCTPAGTALNRLLVYGEQISPDPSLATAKPADTTKTNTPSAIPGNSPTFLERLRDFFF